MLKTYKLLLIGLSVFVLQVSSATAADSAGSSIYKNCIDSVVFELKKKISSNGGNATISIRWSSNGMLIANYSEGGRNADFGPDTPEDVMFQLEKQATSDVTSVKESLAYKMCHSVKD